MCRDIWDRLYLNLGLVHCWEHRCTTGVCWGRCRHCSGNYEAWGASGGKYEARIVIFHILAVVDRFSWISWKAESCWGKSESRWGKSESRLGKLESRWGKRKAVEESGKPFRKIGKPLRKAESRWGKRKAIDKSWKADWGKPDFWQGKSDFWQGKLDFRLGKSQYFPTYSLVSGDFGESFSYAVSYAIWYHVHMDLLCWNQVLTI